MATTTFFLLVLCLIALAILYKAQKPSTKKEEKEKEEPKTYDFTVEFYSKRGWFGIVEDDGVKKYTYLKLPESIPLKKADQLRVTMTGYANGNYEAEAIDLTALPEGAIVPTYRDKKGTWHCMYAGVQGLAFVGYIQKHPLMETPSFKEGQPYRAIKREKDEFSLA